MAPTTAPLAANGHCIADQQQTIAPQFAVVHWLAALQYGLQIVEQGAVNESLIRGRKRGSLPPRG